MNKDYVVCFYYCIFITSLSTINKLIKIICQFLAYSVILLLWAHDLNSDEHLGSVNACITCFFRNIIDHSKYLH